MEKYSKKVNEVTSSDDSDSVFSDIGDDMKASKFKLEKINE